MTKIKTTKKAPGPLPRYGDLHIGRKSDAHRDLTWKRACAEADRRGKISLFLTIYTAPDVYTPMAAKSWGDPRNVRGAMRAAKDEIERGRARYAHVKAEARRHYYSPGMYGSRASWDLGGFERAEEDAS